MIPPKVNAHKVSDLDKKILAAMKDTNPHSIRLFGSFAVCNRKTIEISANWTIEIFRNWIFSSGGACSILRKVKSTSGCFDKAR